MPTGNDLSDLTSFVQEQEAAGRCVGVCHCDPVSLLELGHSFLDDASGSCETLVVVVQSQSQKDFDNWKSFASAFSFVRHIFVLATGTIEFLSIAKPAIYIPAGACLDQLLEIRETVQSYGGRCVILDRFSSQVIDRPQPSIDSFLSEFCGRNRFSEVVDLIQELSSLRVLMIGESILDEYHYCEAMGKAGKEPILAVRFESAEAFPGGVLATANQVSQFSDHVGLVSLLGTEHSREQFIREHLSPKVDAMFHYQPGAPTTVKRRYLEIYPLQKLFEVYTMEDEVPQEISQAMVHRLERCLQNYDVVIVTDYGHGLMTSEVIETLCQHAPFLAVNTQTNAGNQGFNAISKYAKADFVCISEKEFRIEARSRSRDTRLIVDDVVSRLGCRAAICTQGELGSLSFRSQEGFANVPAFTQKIVDRIGAGDAVLALTSLLAYKNVSLELMGFLGNTIGALAVETVGHRNVITRRALISKIARLMLPYQCEDLRE